MAKHSIYLAASEDGPPSTPILIVARALDKEAGQSVGQAHFERPEDGQ